MPITGTDTAANPVRHIVADDVFVALQAAAVDAGRLAQRMRRDGTGVSTKPDGTPVTEADEAAERLILERLTKLAPGVPVVAEESAAIGLLPEVQRSFFLVDPLDGTREYVAGRAEYTVNIALIENGVPVLGLVGVPEFALLFAAAHDRAYAVTLDADGVATSRTLLRARPRPPAPVALVSGSHLDATTQRFLDERGITDTVAFGSALKFCRLATAEGDVYPRFGRTMQWDTAAGDAVLRAAGGLSCRADGTPLVYGPRRGDASDPHPFANPSFVAFGAWTEQERDALLRNRAVTDEAGTA